MTETPSELSPLVRAAANGELPDWARAGAERREHIARVADLLEEWAAALGLPPDERTRWRAAGWLHDSLRDGDPAELRSLLAPPLDDVADNIVHGPAAAAMIGSDADDELRDAVRYHTLGHPSLGRLGRALYLADFLEPGRKSEAKRRAKLREKMPGKMNKVLRKVVARRIRYLLDDKKPIRPETAAFWSDLVADE